MIPNPDDIQNPGRSQPQRLGRYTLRYRIAQGGMAGVYLAQLKATEGFYKWVAIKTIHPHIAEDPKFIRMFLDEARLAARLDHPNVCSVFDFGKVDGVHYLAMEYLDGETLSAVAQRRWSPRGAGLTPCIGARIVADAARGIHAAHELKNDDGRSAGVVHRDISPQNIFVLRNGSAKVMDFGIARSTESSSDLTATGELKGKLPYMSPEQMNHERCDRQTDIWALGVVLWEITVGKRLFKRETEPMTIIAVTEKPIPRPSVHRKGYPADLERIVMRALERERSRRYATAAEMARELETFIARSPEPAYVDDVSAMVTETFADRIEFRAQLLQRGTTESPLEVVVSEPSAPSAVKPQPRSESPSDEDADPTVQVDQLPDFGFGSPPRVPTVIAVADTSEPVDVNAVTAAGIHVAPAAAPARAEIAAPEPMPLTTVVAPGHATARRDEVTETHTPSPPRRTQQRSLAIPMLGALALLGAAGGSAMFFRMHPHGAATHAATAITRPPVQPLAAAVAQTPAPAPPVASPVIAAPAPVVAAPPAPAPNPQTPVAAAPAPANAEGTSSNHPVARANNPPHDHEHTSNASSHATHAARAEPTEAPDETSHVERPGYLYLRSTQPAEVFEGSHSLGRTPVMDHELSSGHHRLHVVADGASRDVDVDIQAGSSAMVTVNW